MKRFILMQSLVLLLLGVPGVFSQQDPAQLGRALDYLDNGGEVYFTFGMDRADVMRNLSNQISIARVRDDVIHAYANRQEFGKFLDYGLQYEVPTHPGDLLKNAAMASSASQMKLEWDAYPTFDAYVEAMHQFAADYPDLCKIYQAGESIRGRELLYAIISDNVNVDEPEPRHLYSSTMHGDEPTGYIMYLRLIDYLLTRYQTDTDVKKLVDNVEIWICPLENPDGLYRNDNDNVSGARRANENGQDLNRHYPRAGQDRNYDPRDPEVQTVIDLMDSLQFLLTTDTHDGAELLNYPYDYANVVHPDDRWMQHVYWKWADLVHTIAPNNFRDQGGGVVRGYNWYQVWGSRLDYTTYHARARDVTFEISDDKMMDGSEFPRYWDMHYQSLLEYIEQNLFGINGTVTCNRADTGIMARVYIQDHDNDQSYMFSELNHGDFWRPIEEGTFSVEFTAEGYHPHVEEDVEVNWDEATVLDIKLEPTAPPVGLADRQVAGGADFTVTPVNGGFRLTFTNLNSDGEAAVVDVSGRLVKRLPINGAAGTAAVMWNGADRTGNRVTNGCYFVSLETGGQVLTKRFMLLR